MRIAMVALSDLSSACPWLDMKLEVADWLAKAMGEMQRPAAVLATIDGLVALAMDEEDIDASVGTRVVAALQGVLPVATRKVARAALAGMTKIAVETDDTTVGLLVARALCDRAADADSATARYALRSVEQLALETACGEVMARMAIRGLLETSFEGDVDFQARAWDMLADAQHRETREAVRADLLRALGEISLHREAELQRENSLDAATRVAPAA